MSQASPPKYQSASEEEQGLLSDTMTYPPAPLPSSSAGSSAQAAGSNTIEELSTVFFFRPRFPIEAEMADALVLLPRTREEAVETACEAFPVLQGFASERIIFSIDSELSLVGRARILKASWIGMRSKPPKNIFVGIEDGPGDAALRKKRETRSKYKKAGVALAIIALVVLFFMAPSSEAVSAQSERTGSASTAASSATLSSSL